MESFLFILAADIARDLSIAIPTAAIMISVTALGMGLLTFKQKAGQDAYTQLALQVNDLRSQIAAAKEELKESRAEVALLHKDRERLERDNNRLMRQVLGLPHDVDEDSK